MRLVETLPLLILLLLMHDDTADGKFLHDCSITMIMMMMTRIKRSVILLGSLIPIAVFLRMRFVELAFNQ